MSAAATQKRYAATPAGKATAARYLASAKAKIKSRRGKRSQRDRDRARLHKLKGAPCADCGGSFHPVCMDFDHRPGVTKLFCVGSSVGLGVSHSAVRAEIAKCDVVCANCHRVRTFLKRDYRSPVIRTPASPDPQLTLLWRR